jgi:acetyl-CoA carboxylase biotin carboxyl carrier protein
MADKTKGGNKMTQVKSTMAGTVFTVNVSEGEEITAGQVVMVLESMKMEIPVESATAGKVTEIKAQVGDFVNEGDVLLTIEA